MANVRLLRQLAKRYDERVNAVNEQYRDDRGIYEKAVEGYNADLAAAKAGTGYLMKMAKGGKYAIFGGTDKMGNLAYKGTEASLYDKPLDNAGVYRETSGDENPDYIVRGEEHWVRNADGTATLYRPGKIGTVSGWGARPIYGYLPSSTTVKIFPESAPTAPTIGDPGRAPFTEKEKGLLQNPTLGPSEMNMAAAHGVVAESSLAGDVPSAPSSPFANPEDPSNLKERGVLARVLGGQL